MKGVVEPAERGADVLDLADSVIVFPLAQPGASKIKAQHGKSEAVQCFHRVEDDFIVEHSPKQRMRMTHNRRVCCILGPGVQQRFKASRRPGEEERSNGGIG